MAFPPHAPHRRALTVLVAWLLLLARSGAFQTETDHAELGRYQNQIGETRRQCEESLNNYRSLAQKHPEAYLPKVAATLNNLGILDRDKNRLEEALKIYRRLAQKDP